jgi:hypothetical protein
MNEDPAVHRSRRWLWAIVIGFIVLNAVAFLVTMR